MMALMRHQLEQTWKNCSMASSTLRSVDDALGALELLTDHGSITVAEVATAFTRSRSSAYRLVRTLVDRGWLQVDVSGRYVAGPRAMTLGVGALERVGLRELARPWLERLSEQTQETVTVSVLVGRQRVCIDQVESPRDVRMTVAIGSAFPLYSGASGRAVLSGMSDEQLTAYLDEVELMPLTDNTIANRRDLVQEVQRGRARQYVVALAERDPDAFAVASWISNTDGVVGSLAICGPMTRFSPEHSERYGPLVRHAGEEISMHLRAKLAPSLRGRSLTTDAVLDLP